MKKLRRYHRKKILKSIEIGSIAGIIGLCGNLILSPEQSKEISSKSTTAIQVNMNEDNLVMNNTEEMIKRDDMLITTVKNNSIDKNFNDVPATETPFILKVEPTGYTYGEIYKTVDYIKRLISNYTIN